MDRRRDKDEALARWWVALGHERRQAAKQAMTEPSLPAWMITSLTDALGAAVIATWWPESGGMETATWSTTTETREIIESMGDWVIRREQPSGRPAYLSANGTWGTEATARWFDTKTAAEAALDDVPTGDTGQAVRLIPAPRDDG